MPLIGKVEKNQPKVKFLMLLITTFLWIGIFLHLFPIWWMFISAMQPVLPEEIFTFPPRLWPRYPAPLVYGLAYYFMGRGIMGTQIFIYFKNSLIITAGIMLIQIPTSALIAYSVSKLLESRWAHFVFLLCVGTLMIPSTVSLIPRFLLMRHFPFPTTTIPKIPFTNKPFPSINFLNSYWAVILPFSYNAFNFLLFKGYFDGISNEVIHAARLDGASELTIFRKVVLPLSRPVFAVVAYFSFCQAWNEFMWPLIVLQKHKLWPMSLFLYNLQQSAFSGPSMGGVSDVMTFSIIESAPIFIIFLLLREELMKGIKIRGLR